MAQIKLTVSPQIETAKFEQLKQQIRSLGTELSNIKPNKDLTAQLNALAKSLNAAARETKTYTKSEKDEALIKQRNTAATLNLAKTRKTNADAALKEKKAVEDSHKTHLIATEGLVDMAAKYVQLQVAMKLIYAPLNLIKTAFDSLNNVLQTTEDRVIEVKRALGDEAVVNQQISSEIYDLAVQYGQTFDNASNIAVKFARSGMEWRDAIKATEAALLALNVAELNAEEASSGLIAIMAQFRLEASDLERVIDELNKTADNFPVTSEKLLTALSRTGSAAVNANLSLEQTIGLITALSKATGRSGQNLGTAINSLIQYSSKSSALDIFSSLSDDVATAVERMRKGTGNILEVWQKVSEVIKNADDRQKSILTGLAESEDIQNLSQELQDELGDIFERTQDVYGTANTFRKNYFIALLDNIDTVIQAQQVATNALDYSQKENLQYMDTLTAKTTALQSKWESLANDEQGWLKFRKGLADIGIGILDVTEATGGLTTAFISLASITTAVFGGKVLSAIKEQVKGMKSAETGALKWNAALGLISLSLNLIISTIIASNKRLEHATEAAKKYASALEEISTSKSARESEIKSLDLLIDRYDELNSKESLTTAEQYDLKQTVDALSTVYGGLNFVLDETTKRYNVQTEAIRNNRAELLKQIETEYYQERAKTAFSSYQAAMEELGYEDISQVRARYDKIKDIRVQGRADAPGQIRWEQRALRETIEMYDEYLKYIGYISSSGAKTATTSGKTLKEQYEGLAKAIAAAKDELSESAKIQEKQLSVIEAQKALEEAIAKAKRDYVNSVLDQYITTLKDALTLEEKQNAVIEARKNLEKAAEEARIKALVNALNTENSKNEKALDIEQKRLAVEQARQALANAQSQRNVRQYNELTKTWEWQANQTEVDNAQKKLDEAMDALNKYLEQQARAEVIDALENGNAAEADINAILAKWAREGMTDTPEWVQRIKSVVESYAKYAPTEEDLKTASEKVESAVNSLNEYLKDQAIAEIKKSISDNGVDPNAIRAILDKWLSKGEGGELYAWGDTIAQKIKEATVSGYYESSAVASQRSALEKAREALSSYQAEKLWDEVTALVDKRAERNEFNALLGKYRGYGVSEDVIVAIIEALNNAGITDIGKVKSKGRLQDQISGARNTISAYDNGGVLDGIGGIKATRKPEMVLSPELTAKILKPTSNAQFERFVQAMGIMFGATSRAGANDVVRNGGNTVTDSHDTHYTVNGVTVPAQYAETHSIKELFNDMRLFKG